MSSHSAVAVANILIRYHRKKRIGVLNSRRILKYVHIADVACAETLKRRLVEDLTMSTRFGPFYESIMREVDVFGNAEISCEIMQKRYSINGDFEGYFMPLIEETALIQLIYGVYDNFCQLNDKEMLDVVLMSKMPWALAQAEESIYIKRKHIEQAASELFKEKGISV